MFAKLLKYEFRTTSRSLGGLTVAALVGGVLGFIINLVDAIYSSRQNTQVFDMIAAPFLSFLLISLIVYIIVAAFIPYKQFYKKKFTDEGYLTFTLPATAHQILLSSMLNTLIWILIAILTTIVSVILIFAPYYTEITQYGYYFTEYESYYTVGDRIINFLKTIGSLLFSFMLPFVALTIGSLVAKKRKIGAAFLVGYGIELVVSFIIQFIDPYYTFLENETTINILNIVVILLYFGLSITGYFVMHHLIKKKLNI